MVLKTEVALGLIDVKTKRWGQYKQAETKMAPGVSQHLVDRSQIFEKA
jgi:hypothetical protein